MQFGASWCFLLNGLSFVAVMICVFLMKVPYAVTYISESSPIQQMREGLNFARKDPLIPPLILMAGVAGLLILPILRLLPAVADVLLHSPEEGYAALSVAEGTGSVIGGVVVGWLGQRLGHGRVIVAAIVINALANILLALQGSVPPAVACTAFFGSSMILLFVSLNTVVQTVVPDQYRARVLSLYSLAMIGTTPFGALALGAIGDQYGIDKALIVNGILIAVLSGAILLHCPNLLRYRTVQEKITIPNGVSQAVGD